MTISAASKNQLPSGIWILGFVSLLMDVSSEIIHSLLPVYLVSVLGASALLVGLMEGSALATAQIAKVFSGALSDYLGKRKGLAVLGYGLSAMTKPVFALAPAIGWIFAARLTDRVGKGIRGAPRDALVADLAPDSLRGAAYGLRQSLDTVGAFLGPLLAIGLMLLWNNDYQAVFWVAVIPAFLGVALLVVGVREPEAPITERRTNPISRESLKQLNKAYWMVVLIAVYPCALQRSLSPATCRRRRAGSRLVTTGAGRHEYRLCAVRLSLREAFRSNESPSAPDHGATGPDRG